MPALMGKALCETQRPLLPGLPKEPPRRRHAVGALVAQGRRQSHDTRLVHLGGGGRGPPVARVAKQQVQLAPQRADTASGDFGRSFTLCTSFNSVVSLGGGRQLCTGRFRGGRAHDGVGNVVATSPGAGTALTGRTGQRAEAQQPTSFGQGTCSEPRRRGGASCTLHRGATRGAGASTEAMRPGPAQPRVRRRLPRRNRACRWGAATAAATRGGRRRG
mmetsp:Transcript_81192/g.263148  ORF Transcript_81192/g.263148 Transcript_81192/m.263148 type:complete len:218 (-) Transcript_81192:160-813(-)